MVKIIPDATILNREHVQKALMWDWRNVSCNITNKNHNWKCPELITFDIEKIICTLVNILKNRYNIKKKKELSSTKNLD